jgi:hypothetical protein
MQQWVPLALVSSYKIFSGVVNNIGSHRLMCKLPYFFADFNKIWSFRQIVIVVPNKSVSQKIHLVENALINAYRQTDRHAKAKQIPFAVCVNAHKIEDN